jgi:hypothetical protein
MPIKNGLEAMADAIQRFEGWDPKTRSYQNRSPGNLRLGANSGYPSDDKGYTIFPDLPTGYSALLRELASKFSGHNTHGIGPASTLLSLMNVYAPAADSNDPHAYAEFVAKWVGLAIGRPITIESELVNIWSAPAPATPPAAPTVLDASDQ